MRRQRLGWVGVLAVLVTPAAWAQPGRRAEPANVQATTGEVLSRSDEFLVVRTEEAPRATFTIGEDTELPRPLVAGSEVLVEYEIQEDGTLHALDVMLNVSREPKKPSPAAAAADARVAVEVDNSESAAGPSQLAEQSRVEPDGLEDNRTEDDSPATTSLLSLILATGLLALAGGFALRRFRRS